MLISNECRENFDVLKFSEFIDLASTTEILVMTSALSSLPSVLLSGSNGNLY
jgi:hypothetical protein